MDLKTKFWTFSCKKALKKKQLVKDLTSLEDWIHIVHKIYVM